MPLDYRIPMSVRGPDPELFEKIQDRFDARRLREKAEREHDEDRRIALDDRRRTQAEHDDDRRYLLGQRSEQQQQQEEARHRAFVSDVAQGAGAALQVPDDQLEAAYNTWADNMEQRHSHYVPKGSMPRQFPDAAARRTYLTEKQYEGLSAAEQIADADRKRTQKIAEDRAKNPDRNYSATELAGDDDKPFDALFENNSGHYYRSGADPNEKIDITADVIGPAKKYHRYQKPARDASPVQVTHEDGSVTLETPRDGMRVKPAGNGVTPAQKAQAERWKQSNLTALEQQFTDGLIGRDELEAGKLRIQQSYQQQMGIQPDMVLDEGWNRWRGNPAPMNPAPDNSAPMNPAPMNPAPTQPTATEPRDTPARTEAKRVLQQFQTETDPAKKEQLRQRLIQLRAQIAGA